MRKILIVGAGQAGLQLGLSLLAEGYDVTLMSARTPDEIRDRLAHLDPGDVRPGAGDANAPTGWTGGRRRHRRSRACTCACRRRRASSR